MENHWQLDVLIHQLVVLKWSWKKNLLKWSKNCEVHLFRFVFVFENLSLWCRITEFPRRVLLLIWTLVYTLLVWQKIFSVLVIVSFIELLASGESYFVRCCTNNLWFSVLQMKMQRKMYSNISFVHFKFNFFPFNVFEYLALGKRFSVPFSAFKISVFLGRKYVAIHLDDFLDKFNYLALSARKLCALVVGECAAESTDSPANMEVLTSGHLYSLVIKVRSSDFSIALSRNIYAKFRTLDAFLLILCAASVAVGSVYK